MVLDLFFYVTIHSFFEIYKYLFLKDQQIFNKILTTKNYSLSKMSLHWDILDKLLYRIILKSAVNSNSFIIIVLTFLFNILTGRHSNIFIKGSDKRI